MFCINICFWSRSQSEPSFYGWSWSRYFLPGAGAETKNIRSRGKLVWLRNTGIAKFYLDIVRVTLELHELGTGPGVPDTQHLLSRPAHYHRPCKQTYRFDTTDKKHSDYNYFFFCVRGRFPSLPLSFTLLHNDPAANQDHCGRCRI